MERADLGMSLMVTFSLAMPGVAPAATDDCERALVPESKPWVTEHLGRVKSAIDARDLEDAELNLDAAGRFPRSADVSISPRCLGPELAGQMFLTRQQIFRNRAIEAVAAGDPRRATDLYIRGGDLAQARGLTADLPDEAPRYKAVLRTLAGQVESGPSLSVGGGLPPTPQESRHFEACATFRGEITNQARDAAQRRLNAEMKLMQSPLSDVEQKGLQAQRVMAAFAGGQSGDQPIPIETLRASRSVDDLRSARDLLDVASADPAAVSNRAVKRGERLMALADDDGLLLEARQMSADAAVDYFDLGDADESQSRASELSRRLQAQLVDQHARQERELEARQSELEASAEGARKAAADMEKTDAEKKAFSEEADALEAELDF